MTSKNTRCAQGTTAARLSRRNFLAATATAGASALAPGIGGGPSVAEDAPPTPDALVRTSIKINGTDHALSIDPRTTVLDLLREQLDLTGTKVGCNHGQCGACTVLLNGRRVNSCLLLAVAADGQSLVTIEGLGQPDGKLHPMQAAFIEEDGFQCGYCTPGQIISAVSCVAEGHANSDAEIREYMSGNLCRCGAYKGIVEAVKRAREATRQFDLSALTEDAK